MLYIRGQEQDYNMWRQLGNVGWSWKDVLPYFIKAENQEHLYPEWAPYFLYMLFERYKVLKENNFKFNIPDEVNAAVKEYQEEASTYTQFFNDKIEEAPGYKVDATTLYNEFQLFVGRDFKTQKTENVPKSTEIKGLKISVRKLTR